MKRAVNLLRESLHYRKGCFNRGLQACGYEVVGPIKRPDPEDVLLIWNRYGSSAEQARHFENNGARVIVAENGYLGKDWNGGEWFSLALGHHLGAGVWNVGGPERWQSIGCELASWRTGGDTTLVFEQRGIGEPGYASPPSWASRAVRMFETRVRVRAHPGKDMPRVSLLDDLKDCQATATWASAAALHALIHGVPVWYDMPDWIGAGAGRPLHEYKPGQQPKRDDASRLRMFERLAWSIWNLKEIEDGTAFARLLALR